MELVKDSECLEDLQFNNLFIIQEREGYRFTSDAIALANFVDIKSGGTLVDLCSGSGVIGILAHAKRNLSHTTLVEIQPTLADMSRRSLQYNSIESIDVINSPLQNVNKVIGVGKFDGVVCNPPYKKMGSATKLSSIETIAIAKHEIKVTLEDVFCEGSKLLKFGGYFYIVNKEERLADMIVFGRKYNLEPKVIKILPSTKGASVVMIKYKKGGNSGLTIRYD